MKITLPMGANCTGGQLPQTRLVLSKAGGSSTAALKTVSTKSSTLMTQCSSNKQIKQTPETTARQRCQISTFSSTSKKPHSQVESAKKSQGSDLKASREAVVPIIAAQKMNREDLKRMLLKNQTATNRN